MAKINVSPHADALWKGIGGHFDSFSEIIYEFIDNIISNYDKHKSSFRAANISIEPVGDSILKVKIEDCGSGIENLQSALRLGDVSIQETPLNEHGFGFKHALASANPENDAWTIYTRTDEDLKNGQYKVIKAPYEFDIEEEIVSVFNTPWPGMMNNSGTIFEFTCSKELFDTLIYDGRGNPGISKCLEFLSWDLGYVYSNIIKEGRLSLTIFSNKVAYNQQVAAIEPDWIGLYKPREGSLKRVLDENRVEIQYKFGEVRKNTTSKKHYQRNMSTSGLEIRINGRLLEENLLGEVWGIEQHNKYNHFLAQINIISENPNYLPKTRTSKNGIRIGDKKILDLFKWIRSMRDKPPEKTSKEFSERELIKKLKDIKEQTFENMYKKDSLVENEFEVYKIRKTPVKVDLYVFDGDKITLYEAKKGTADMKAFYQLLMYWDGAVDDRLEPQLGVLLAENFSEGVKDLMNDFNQKKDANGKNYNFIFRTWKKEGIDLE
ncbi:hypothetical protein [Priestia megaterium]|uniref:hypothetical protein n=1 Tax=Priestia megaterium TaxID=1404 RepID=UPI002E1B8890|nr:hypothetical protein [Priestia megaterium]